MVPSEPRVPGSHARAVVYSADSHEELAVESPGALLRLLAPGRVVWLDLSLDTDAG
jgi:hypothetical protein